MLFLNIILVTVLLRSCKGFYLPAYPPNDYCIKGYESGKCQSDVHIYANSLDSMYTLLKQEYSSFDFCSAKMAMDKPVDRNLGQYLAGDRISATPYNVSFIKDENCRSLCDKNYNSNNKQDMEDLERLKWAISKEYNHRWILDDMPMIYAYTVTGDQIVLSKRFPIGCYISPEGVATGFCGIDSRFTENDTFYLMNHLDFYIEYATSMNEYLFRIVRVKVVPSSKENCLWGKPMSFPGRFGRNNESEETLRIPYTYSVKFIENNNIRWSSRWDYILDANRTGMVRVQWFSTMNSTFVTIMLVVVLARILHRLAKIKSQWIKKNPDSCSELAKTEAALQAIKGDVFRPPKASMLLATLLGSGTQLNYTALVVLVFGTCGFLSEANPGGLLTCLVITWICLFPLSGYISGRMYKMLGGAKHMTHDILTTLLCPGILVGVYLVMNAIERYCDSTPALPFIFLASIPILFLVFFLMVLCGTFFGYRKKVIQCPSSSAKPGDSQVTYKRCTILGKIVGVIIGGFLTFGATYINMYFISQSIWVTGYTYNAFGQVLLTFIVSTVTNALCGAWFSYHMLSHKDYNWWWRSFAAGVLAGVFMYIYMLNFFLTKTLIADTASIVLYFGYNFIIAFAFSIASGTVNFYASFWFIRMMYTRFIVSEEEVNLKVGTKGTAVSSKDVKDSVIPDEPCDNSTSKMEVNAAGFTRAHESVSTECKT